MLAWAEPGEPQVRWEAQAMMAQVLLVVPLVVQTRWMRLVSREVVARQYQGVSVPLVQALWKEGDEAPPHHQHLALQSLVWVVGEG